LLVDSGFIPATANCNIVISNCNANYLNYSNNGNSIENVVGRNDESGISDGSKLDFLTYKHG